MAKLKVSIRCFLGFVFILYSLLKFFRMHPYDIHLAGDIHAIASSDLFWYFFGYSQAYVIYIGAIEICSGILIILPQTFRVGALMLAVMASNIAILDFVYSVGPVRYWASFLAILSFALIFSEWPSYREAIAVLMWRPYQN